jgi:hypothetical protein
MLNGCNWPSALTTASRTRMRFAESGNGSGRRRTWFTALNIAVFAPMPSARIATAMALLRGVRLNGRNA